MLQLERLEPRILLSGVSAYALQTLASFNGTTGSSPVSGLIMDGGGNLYGTTKGGGANNAGTVFEIAAGSNTITTLASFNGTTNGLNPAAGLVMDGSGNLYGTTVMGGAGNDGTVFEIVQGSGTITTLASFSGTNGSSPEAGLVMDGGGNLYGTTSAGGAGGYGTVFEIVSGSGTITTIASFTYANGSDPAAGLVLDGSGNLCGTTGSGGAYGEGTVYEIAAASSTITTLASFDGTHGSDPLAGLIMDGSGNLYGTTEFGGANGDGTLYEIAAGSGTITTLATFNGSNGKDPLAGLIMDGSGNLYGTTSGGGANNLGTVFALAAGSGTITTLAEFNLANGSEPYAGLIMDGSGNLYGTTGGGGANNKGTVFELSPVTAPTEIGQWTHGPITITAYVTINPPDADAADIRVVYGPNNSVTSIKLTGSDAMTGLGLVISGATSVGTINDARTGSPGAISFIASEAPIGVLSLETGATGYALNGLTLGGVTFGDLDGNPSDLTALYCKGAREVTLGGGVTGDLVFDGVNNRGFSLGFLFIETGGLSGELYTTGSVASARIDWGDVNDMDIGGSLDSLTVYGGNTDGTIEVADNIVTMLVQSAREASVPVGGTLGGTVTAGGNIGTIDVKGVAADPPGALLSATVTAGSIGSVTVQNGDFTGELVSTATPTRAAAKPGIGSVHVFGGNAEGTITAANDIGVVWVQSAREAGVPVGGTLGGTISAGHNIGTVDVYGISANPPGALLSATVTAASIGAVAVQNGNFTGDLDSTGTPSSAAPTPGIGSLIVFGGNAEGTITAANNIGNILVLAAREAGVPTGGTLGGTITAGRNIRDIDVAGVTINPPDALLSAGVTAAGIGAVTVQNGSFTGVLDSTATPTLTAPAAGIGYVDILGGDAEGTITAANDIGTILVQRVRKGGVPAGGTLGGTITAGGRIGTIEVNGITANPPDALLSATVTAAQIGVVRVRDGDLAGTLNSTGAIGTVSVVGGDFSGGINAGGRIDLISISKGSGGGDVSAGATISAGGSLHVLTVQGSILGEAGGNVSISADSVGLVRIGGDVEEAQFSFLAVPAPKLDDIRIMEVGGALDGSSILCTGNIGTLSVQTMQDSLVYAGVESGVTGLPDPATDFNEEATISVLSVRGARNGADSFINSDVAGYNLRLLRLPLVQTANGDVPFGVAANDYTILVFSDSTGRHVYENSAPVQQDGDFNVLLK